MAVPYNATGLWPSANLGDAPRYASGVAGQVAVSAPDTVILRDLATRVAGLAALPEQKAKRELWTAHNDLATRHPMVLVDPENGWNEIIKLEDLRCAGPLARRWEMVLRKELYSGETARDDRPIEPLFEVARTFTDTEWGMPETYHGGVSGESYTWEGAVVNPEDVARIATPRITVDEKTTEETRQLAEHVFGGILRVGLRDVWWWSLGMTYDLARLVGLEKMLYLMYDTPAMVHAIMARLRDGYLSKVRWLEAQGLLSLNNHHAYVGSGGLGYTTQLPAPGAQAPGARTDGAGPTGVRASAVRTRDMWCLTESQETIGVSPEQFEEFVFPYQLPLQELFGLNCYGCCEPLDSRWHIVKRIPRLRRVSVSAWADQAKMAAALEDRYVYSRKPSPAVLAVPHADEEVIRADLRKTLEITRGCVLELIMKDNHTLGKNPENLVRWVRIAREEIDRAGV